MSPDQLRQLRSARKQTRQELAADLHCSASAIVQWEGGTRAIPAWVGEKMLRNVPLTLPIEDLQTLLDLSRETGRDFAAILGQAVRDYLKTTKSKQPE